MKVRTLQADSVRELDGKLNEYLSAGWLILGDMQTHRYKRQHAVYGYDVWDIMFTQRVSRDEPK